MPLHGGQTIAGCEVPTCNPNTATAEAAGQNLMPACAAENSTDTILLDDRVRQTVKLKSVIHRCSQIPHLMPSLELDVCIMAPSLASFCFFVYLNA